MFCIFFQFQYHFVYDAGYIETTLLHGEKKDTEWINYFYFTSDDCELECS